ncbi:MAG: aminoacyl-tRNA hydrolase [Calditrichales bacterium]|nr:MAG: aminoacyl-tRNA hydrolase [Calditrichales bacterium]
MYALVGLGNHGKRYQNTRHNIGYFVLDYLASKDKIPFKSGKGDYYYNELLINQQRVVLVKPTTYMNRSGLAVKQVIDYFPVEVADVMIICDDFNLPFGTIRVRNKGSAGGHNGLKSIMNHLHSEEFVRMRLGIGNQFSDAVSFVLDNFNRQEIARMEDFLPFSAEAIECWIKSGIDTTMNKYNRQFLQD